MKDIYKPNVFRTLGATNHSDTERELHDFYATSPSAVEELLKVETFNKEVWDNCVGKGHIAEVLKKHNYNVKSSDLIDRGYPDTEIKNFFEYNKKVNMDIIINPPYSHAIEFANHSLDIIRRGFKLALFVKLLFLEGQKRRILFDRQPPKIVYVFSKRTNCARDGRFDLHSGSAVAYCWIIWEKGYKGITELKWIN